MPKVFKVSPKRKTSANGEVLSPAMEVVITTKLSCPFNNGGKEVQEAFLRMYGVDIKKAGVSKSYFNIIEDK